MFGANGLAILGASHGAMVALSWSVSDPLEPKKQEARIAWKIGPPNQDPHNHGFLINDKFVFNGCKNSGGSSAF